MTLEGSVKERSKAVLIAAGGALVGGAVGYLCFTEHGRSIRRELEPTLDDIVHELDAFRRTVEKTASVANRGWTLISSARR